MTPRARWTLLGVPVDSVGRAGGTEHGPPALRAAGLADRLRARDAGDLDVRIRGDARDPGTGVVAWPDVAATTTAVRQAVRGIVAAGERPLVLGGCCTLVPGALGGLRDAAGRTGLAYLDGHLDLYDGTTSPTGEAADMPVSVVLGRGPDAWALAAGGGPILAADDVEILGFRDREEALALGHPAPEDIAGLSVVDADGVRAAGPATVGAGAARRLAGAGAGFWLHVDVDVLDQAAMPATDYLMPGGLSWEDLAALMGPLAASPGCLGANVTCFNPDKDPDGEFAGRLVDLLVGALVPGAAGRAA